MPADQGGRGDVRSIYRVGDRVLVELPSGFYQMVVQSAHIAGGELWLEGRASDFYTTFPARLVVRRLAPGEVFTRPGAG